MRVRSCSVTARCRPRLQVVVGNDGGGTIFDGLEVAATAPADAMTRVQFTPQTVDLSALAAAYGWHYVARRDVVPNSTRRSWAATPGRC